MDILQGFKAAHICAPPALAALNGGVFALMDWLEVPEVAAAMSHFCIAAVEALYEL